MKDIMKDILLYLVLVGVPVAGIYGIVCLGQDLKPPMSVAGAWNVELTPPTTATSPCQRFIVSSESLILKVTQTGRYLDLTLNNQNATRLSGEVNLETLTAKSLEQEATQRAPRLTSQIELQANVHRESGLDRLSGTLRFPNCPAGSDLSFTAIRRKKGAGGG